MKLAKSLGVGIAGLGLAFSAMTASAQYALDTKIGEALLGNSGDATVEAALESFAGVDVSLSSDMLLSGDYGPFVNDANSWYLNVDPLEPGYFVLKFGTGSLGSIADHYFFQNIAELTKLVWSNEQVNGITGGCRQCNIDRLSFYRISDSVPPPPGNGIPEPGTLALLGLALAGASLVSRRKQ